jgi:hypothetical protein
LGSFALKIISTITSPVERISICDSEADALEQADSNIDDLDLVLDTPERYDLTLQVESEIIKSLLYPQCIGSSFRLICNRNQQIFGAPGSLQRRAVQYRRARLQVLLKRKDKSEFFSICRFHGLVVRVLKNGGVELIQDLRTTRSGAGIHQSPILPAVAFTDTIQSPTQNDNLLAPQPTSNDRSKMSSIRPKTLLLTTAGLTSGTIKLV